MLTWLWLPLSALVAVSSLARARPTESEVADADSQRMDQESYAAAAAAAIKKLEEHGVLREVMLQATRGLNQTQADALLSTLQHTHVSNTTMGDQAYHAHQRSHRQRNKEIRIKEIKSRVLGYLERYGRKRPHINSSLPRFQQHEMIQDLYKGLQNLKTLAPSEVYTEKVQSLYPSCELPRNTHEDLWSDGKSLHLMFDMSYPAPAEGTIATIIAAKLRLYKLSQGNLTMLREGCPAVNPMQTQEPLEQGDQTNPQDLTNRADLVPEEKQDLKQVEQRQQTHGEPVADQSHASSTTDEEEQTDQEVQEPHVSHAGEDMQVRVSVYWYTRSLKRHRVKRKLLDSKMLSVYGEEWTEFNIRTAARAWRDSRKNFGLVVEVEDEDGQMLDAAKYFTTFNCSNQASAAATRPVNGLFIHPVKAVFLQNPIGSTWEGGVRDEPSDGSRKSGDNPDTSSKAAHTFTLDPVYINALLFPMMDVCTVELFEPEVMNMALYREMQDAASRLEETDPSQDSHSSNDQDSESDQELDRDLYSSEEILNPFVLHNTRRHLDRHGHKRRHQLHSDKNHDAVTEENRMDWPHEEDFDVRKHIINKTMIFSAYHAHTLKPKVNGR